MRCSRNILSAGMGVAALCTVIVAIAVPAIAEDETIRIGMIGLDTSHATDFTAILNEGQVAGARVVAGVKQVVSYVRIHQPAVHEPEPAQQGEPTSYQNGSDTSYGSDAELIGANY